MSNPSTIWAQLSLPNPPAGAVPFVASDNATITVDVLKFWWDDILFNLHAFNSIICGAYSGSGGFTGNGQAQFGATASGGAVIEGKGSTYDVVLFNAAMALVAAIPTGTLNLQILGAILLGASGTKWSNGNGTPSAVLAGVKGDMFTRLDGAVGSTLYVCNGGTVWNAVAGV